MPWTPLGVYLPFKRGISVAYGKGSAAAVISSPNFPDDYQQGVATATCLGRYFVAISKHSGEKGYYKASDRLDVMSHRNSIFRPVDIEFGMDGAMYVSDFSSPIIGHAQHAMRDPQWDHDHGRIWRVIYRGSRWWKLCRKSRMQQMKSYFNFCRDLRTWCATTSESN